MRTLKHLRPVAFTFCLVTALTVPAVAEQNHFYFKADVGGTKAEDVELRGYFGQPIAANSEITLDPGLRLGLHFGYGLTDWLAAEIETGMSANRIDNITAATQADGSLLQVPLLLNLKLHLPEQSRVSPYVGAGFGVASTVLIGDDITIMHPTTNPPGTGTTTFEGTASDAVFAYQAFAGLSFAVDEYFSVGAEYRFFRGEAASITADSTSGTPSDRLRLGPTEIHSVSVFCTLRF